MFFGWTGFELEVDLESGAIARSEADLDLYTKYMAGRGLGAKLFWDRVPPEAKPFSPENALVINPGLLAGTICPGANRTTITTRSPQINLQTYGVLGGFWAAELKHAGYDSLVVTRSSIKPVYLLIADGKAELRDAGHLWGKDVFETQRLIREETQDEDVQVMCIGPTGECKVHFASVEHGNGSSASRAGIGAIFGDKNLKAIAVRGRHDVRIAKPEQFGELCGRLVGEAGPQKSWTDDIPHNEVAGLARHAQTGNLETVLFGWDVGDIHESFIKEMKMKRSACFNCQLACRKGFQLEDGGQAFLKCVSHVMYAAAFKIRDLRFNLRAYQLVERLGLDTFSTVRTAVFAIDLYEKGILTLADTDGEHLEFGSEVVALGLIEKIGRRQGIGDVLANGVVEAARGIGRGAEQVAYHIKGLEVTSAAMQKPYSAFVGSLADKPDGSRGLSYAPQHLFMKPKPFVEWYVDSGFWQYPDEWKKYANEPWDPAGGDWERMSKMISWDRDVINLSDNLGICLWWSNKRPYSPITPVRQAQLFSYATGIDLDVNGALEIAARSGALIRAYNVILGMRREDDVVPAKVFRDPAAPLYAALDRQKFEKVVEEFYKLRGWNARGIPTAERLGELGLADVADDLRRRGLYGEPASRSTGLPKPNGRDR